MSELTEIEWCDASLSPWWGCTKVSPGCAHCYAETMDYRFAPKDAAGRSQAHWGKRAPRKRIKGFEKNALRINRKAEQSGKRLKVFPSMCDPLDPEVPIDWLVAFLDVIRRTPGLDWLLLTKRPELWQRRMELADAEIAFFWLEWIGDWLTDRAPANVWMGTSVEDQKRADERIPELLRIPVKVRFLSVEPLLGPVDLWGARYPHAGGGQCGAISSWHGRGEGIDWVIVGGESGPKARPMHPDWVRSLRDQCQTAGVPFFFKQWGDKPGVSAFCNSPFVNALMGQPKCGRLLDGREWNEFPKERGER